MRVSKVQNQNVGFWHKEDPQTPVNGRFVLEADIGLSLWEVT